MKKRMLSLTIFTLFSISVYADVSYVCVTDFESGFHYDKDRSAWKNATFLPGERFVINEQREDIYKVEKIGDDSAWSAMCTRRTDKSDDSFSCMSEANQFHFNRKEMRFTAFRYFGYWNGSTDSLSISIGQCFPE
ncbi:MAG: hypothetical protein ACR2QI_02770 [Woeseiaceae bacterium]